MIFIAGIGTAALVAPAWLFLPSKDCGTFYDAVIFDFRTVPENSWREKAS
jgi:hypothetical protein